MGWSREINNDPGVPQPNPRLLDGKAPSYQIFIKHVLPNPVPPGATQMWQVIGCTVFKVKQDKKTGECKASVEMNYYCDIVNIGGRAKIGDNLAHIWREDLCFLLEICVHVVGFDDGKSNYAQQTSVKITKGLADTLRRKMGRPKDTFHTAYIWRDPNCDCDLGFFGAIPGGESLWIEGIGTFPKPPDAPKKRGTRRKGKTGLPRERLLAGRNRSGPSLGSHFNSGRDVVSQPRRASARVKKPKKNPTRRARRSSRRRR